MRDEEDDEPVPAQADSSDVPTKTDAAVAAAAADS